jgi:hypothetical protein
MAKADIYRVLASFVGTLDGREVEYHEGDLVEADDPAFKKWPTLFGPLQFAHARTAPVEQATAAPGEQRVAVGHALTTDDVRPKRRG